MRHEKKFQVICAYQQRSTKLAEIGRLEGLGRLKKADQQKLESLKKMMK